MVMKSNFFSIIILINDEIRRKYIISDRRDIRNELIYIYFRNDFEFEIL